VPVLKGILISIKVSGYAIKFYDTAVNNNSQQTRIIANRWNYLLYSQLIGFVEKN
jgi:hypothetical protein